MHPRPRLRPPTTILVGAVVLFASTMAAGAGGAARELPGRDSGPPNEAAVEGPAAGRPIRGRYIVVVGKQAPAAAKASVRADALAAGGEVHHEYATAINGFAATLPEPAVRALRRNPNVVLLEADQTIHVDERQSPVTWGLDRIDQRALPLDRGYTYELGGAGVTAYVISRDAL
jgi:hypothetical protein